MGFVRLVVFGLIILTAIYFAISIYSRSVRREKLEKRWDADNPGGDPAARSTYIEEGMREYASGFRKKLILLVYIVPICAVGAILYLTN
jgi:hypothetical protein